MHILQCMGSKFCVKFQRCPLKFHTKLRTHTPQNMHFTVFYICVWVTTSLNCDVISLSETGPGCATFTPRHVEYMGQIYNSSSLSADTNKVPYISHNSPIMVKKWNQKGSVYLLLVYNMSNSDIDQCESLTRCQKKAICWTILVPPFYIMLSLMQYDLVRIPAHELYGISNQRLLVLCSTVLMSTTKNHKSSESTNNHKSSELHDLYMICEGNLIVTGFPSQSITVTS